MGSLTIGRKIQHGSYFELEYTMSLDIPQAQQAKVTSVQLGQAVSEPTSQTVSGLVSFGNDAQLSDIKRVLEGKLADAQFALNNDTSLTYNGITFDGSAWSV